jgi:excisionase family DNA binding protein
VAQALGLSESSIKRWCDQGRLPTVRTAGGHRRLAIPDVVEFLRRSGNQLVRPELLGLSSNCGHGAAVMERARDQIGDALFAGDEDQCRRIVFDLYLTGQSTCEIFDRVIASALHEIGEQWECGEASIYRERRACEMGLKTLYELLMALRPPAADAPLAIGGTLECDPYRLPTSMIEVVLREQGWRATSLGSQLPTTTLAEAACDHRPQLLWLSVSCIESIPTFLAEYSLLHRCATAVGAAVVVGGRALTAEIRQRMTYSAYCDTLRHLVTFAISISAATAAQRSAEKSAD